MSYILLAIFIYLMYRITVGILLPVIRTSAEVKRKMREMHNQQSEYYDRRNDHQPVDHEPKATYDKGEYIEFEDIKD